MMSYIGMDDVIFVDIKCVLAEKQGGSDGGSTAISRGWFEKLQSVDSTAP